MDNGEGSSSGAQRERPVSNTSISSNPKVNALLAAAPRLTLEDQNIEPPSYDDANSIQSGHVTLQSGGSTAHTHPLTGRTVGTTDAEEFRYAFEVANSHDELFTNSVRDPNAKGTVLAITRLALGSRRVNTQNPMVFKLSSTPLSANQLEIQAKTNPEQGIKSLRVGMFDIPDDDPDIQFGMIDWMNRPHATGSTLPDIYFEPAYPMPPDILCFLNSFAWKGYTPRRVTVNCRGSSQYGFHPDISAGIGASNLLDCKAAWIAIPKDSQRFDCGIFDVVSKSVQPKSSFFGTATFAQYKFPKKRPPKIFIGLSGLECEGSRAFRYSISITGQSEKGFSWVVRSWDDAVLNAHWKATVSWIAMAT